MDPANVVATTTGYESARHSSHTLSTYGFAILRGLQGKRTYDGTVPFDEIVRRRAANRVARRSRRINRLRGAR